MKGTWGLYSNLGNREGWNMYADPKIYNHYCRRRETNRKTNRRASNTQILYIREVEIGRNWGFCEEKIWEGIYGMRVRGEGKR